MSDDLCTRDDEFVRLEIRWVVRLNDDTTVYQDDDRPGVSPPSAWLRLGGHCVREKLWIVEMRLQFRSNIVQVEPSNADGYFFSKGAAMVCGVDATHHSYLAGTLRGDGKVHLVRYQVPALVVMGEEARAVGRGDSRLICRPGKD